MKLITWNVNSVRQRLPRLLAALERHEPDIVCLQETKVEDANFPTMEVSAAGYESRLLVLVVGPNRSEDVRLRRR